MTVYVLTITDRDGRVFETKAAKSPTAAKLWVESRYDGPLHWDPLYGGGLECRNKQGFTFEIERTTLIQ